MILIDKPEGITSNRVVQVTRRLFNANRAGHTGALDPLATGMLPVCLGEATKFSQFLLDADKSYRVTAKLGERTNTSDADGEVIETKSVPSVGVPELEQAIAPFKGEIEQVASMFSALKYEGKPLYEYARAGIEVPRKKRRITLYSIDIVDIDLPFITLDVACSKGTYIRSFIDDLGQALGCGAHVTVLRRTAVADYPMQSMLSLSALEELASSLPEGEYTDLDQLLLPMDTPVASLPLATVSDVMVGAFTHGQPLDLEASEPLLRIFDDQGVFWGLAEQQEDKRFWPKRVVVYS
ncbi:tRNA pseudouridine(55) synthase TruB [Lysobacter sp. N42]|uniref:tRNA pseudouridine(55) synthase TruB n=2 Tax=Gammaproteobacteria TaxID=1236 RepID=UPI001A9F1F3F|nr:tRNA pseudouridine(55) synthase TruB [Lysobacter sp. N42]